MSRFLQFGSITSIRLDGSIWATSTAKRPLLHLAHFRHALATKIQCSNDSSQELDCRFEVQRYKRDSAKIFGS